MLLSGEVHYPRVPEKLWEDRLKKLKRAGFNAATFYFFWNFHELSPGIFDFSGQRDVDELMEITRRLGLQVIARVGPYVCAEWDNGGHPTWVSAGGGILRSLDPLYMRDAERWLRIILSKLSKYDLQNRGNVVGVQLENEYFHGNMPFHQELARIARECGIKVDLYTNANRHARNTNFIDSLDLYPDPWKLDFVTSSIKNIALTQPSYRPKIMEYEGGWFSKITRPLPTERGEIPAKWTRMLLATALAYGSDLISFYMFHGGTNFGRWTGRWITTTYDYHAMVREWGELSDRYYEVKTLTKLAQLLDGSELEEVREEGSRIRVSRKNEKGRFTFRINNSDEAWKDGDVNVGPREVRVTAEGLRFRGLRLSSNVDLLGTYEDTVIFYGDAGEKFYVKVEDGEVLSLYGAGEKDGAVMGEVSGIKGFLAKGEGVTRVLVVERRFAERTWDFGYPLIGDAYYVEDADERGITLQVTGPSTIFMPARAGLEEVKELALSKLSVDGKPSHQEAKVKGLGLAPLMEVPRGKFDSPPSEEDLGLWHGGFVSYSTELSGEASYGAIVNDFAAVLHGSIESGYCYVEGRAPKGKLKVIADSTGHPNDGLIPHKTGLLSLLLGKGSSERIVDWKYSLVDLSDRFVPGIATANDHSKLLMEDMEALFSKIDSWSSELPEVRSPLVVLYAKAEFKGRAGPLLLKIGTVKYPILVLVNGKRAYLGWGNDAFSTYVSAKAVDGINTVIIASPIYNASGRVRPNFDDVQVTSWDVEARGFEVATFAEGQRESLETAKIGSQLSLKLPRPSAVYVDFDLTLDPMGDHVSPMYAELEGPFVAELYLNGFMIGHYYDKGSQKRFYLPEPYLKASGNEIKIVALPSCESAEVKVSFGSYFAAERVHVDLRKLSARQ
ncbi:MAG: beta-galactosidase [Thermoprotei archaeon]|jgi:beta-galactosidase